MKKQITNLIILSSSFFLFSCSSGDLTKDIYYDAAEVRKTVSNKEGESNAEKFEEYRNKFIGKEVEVELWVSCRKFSFKDDEFLKGRLIVKDKDKVWLSGSEKGSVERFIGDNLIEFSIPFKDIQDEYKEKLKGHLQFVFNFFSTKEYGVKASDYDPEYCGDNVHYLSEQLGQRADELVQEFRDGELKSTEIIRKVLENQPVYYGEVYPFEDKYKMIVEWFEREKKDNGMNYFFNLSKTDRQKIKSINDKANETYENQKYDVFAGLLVKVSGKIESVMVSEKAQKSTVFRNLRIAESPFYFNISEPVISSVEFINPDINELFEKSKITIEEFFQIMEKSKNEIKIQSPELTKISNDAEQETAVDGPADEPTGPGEGD